MSKLELAIIGFPSICTIEYNENGQQTVQIHGMHLSEDGTQWLFDEVEDKDEA